MISLASSDFEMKDIKQFCREWKASLKDRLDGTGAKLYIIQVGDVEASNRYVKHKMADAAEIGLAAEVLKYPADIRENELYKNVRAIAESRQELPTGIIVQLPLPAHINKDVITMAIPAAMDVDGFRIDSPYEPCTPLGIISYLNACNFEFTGANVTIIGRSDIVGKPLAKMFTDRDSTVTLCHSKTKNLHKHLERADLIISAVGKAKFLNCYPIYVPVVDVGINFNEEGKLCGDCYNVEGRLVTPVPGGVGLLTRCALMENMAVSVLLKDWMKEIK